jgi:hypothetical protein
MAAPECCCSIRVCDGELCGGRWPKPEELQFHEDFYGIPQK